MSEPKVSPLSQKGRPPCSLPIGDADLNLNNANWAKGCLSMAEWCWTGNMIPNAVPGYLGQFFLHLPGVLEHQLHYSTTLIFDEPSFRNGTQVSGFLQRVTKELLTNFIAQRRRCWYTANHHAFLGRLTADKHGLSEEEFTNKWVHLTEHEAHPESFTCVERAALVFADAFATNPKTYTDEAYAELRAALAEDNRRRYPGEGLWLTKLQVARAARAKALAERASEGETLDRIRAATAAVSDRMSYDLNERTIDAQLMEMAFHCLQYVALSTVFTGLNIPDEPPFPDFMAGTVPGPVIAHINELNRLGGEGLANLVPQAIDLPLDEILAGNVIVEPAPLRGARLSPVPSEDPASVKHDKGLTVGGAQMAAWSWLPGRHYPNSLTNCLLLHPELARFAPSYELALVSNEDQWRNGVQTAGYVGWRLKELAALKVCRLVRSRWGVTHSTATLFEACLSECGRIREIAVKRARDAVLHMDRYSEAPSNVYTSLEKVLLSWTEDLVTRPHRAHEREAELRTELDRENRRETAAGLRRLDRSPDLEEDAAHERLIHHQVAELAMMIGHRDGQARLATILRLEDEEAADSRPGIHDLLRELGADDAVITTNELLSNPKLVKSVWDRLGTEPKVVIGAETAAATGEF